ncbi:MAG: hypothetical protein ACTS3T_00670 [Almyronema sp.]
MKSYSSDPTPHDPVDSSNRLTPEQEQLQYERARSEQLARENQNLRLDRSAQIAQHNVAVRRDENRRLAQQRANETTGFFWAIIVAILAVLGFGTFYFFGRTETDTVNPAPQQQELPDINVEAPDVEIPDVNVPNPPAVEAPDVNIEVPNPVQGTAEPAPAPASPDGATTSEPAEGTAQ